MTHVYGRRGEGFGESWPRFRSCMPIRDRLTDRQREREREREAETERADGWERRAESGAALLGLAGPPARRSDPSSTVTARAWPEGRRRWPCVPSLRTAAVVATRWRCGGGRGGRGRRRKSSGGSGRLREAGRPAGGGSGRGREKRGVGGVGEGVKKASSRMSIKITFLLRPGG